MRSEETTWIARARMGDDQAFAYLVEAYQVPVFNLCYRMLADPEEAEDAAQEVFLKAHRGLRRYDPQRPFVNWLLSIASHHCIDRLRRRRIVPISLENLLPGGLPADPAPGPEEALAEQEKSQDVQRLLDRLSASDRAAIVLRYWYELSYEEIGAALNQSVSAVKSRLHRARRNMAEAWQSVETRGVMSDGRTKSASTF